MKNIIFYFLLIIIQSFAAKGAELFDIYSSTRALGMGGAFTALATGQDALFYNPAGLVENKGYNLTILNMKLGADGMNAYTAYQNYQNSSGSTLNQLNSLFGQQLWLGGGGKVAFTGPNFGVSLFDMFNVSLNMANPALPNLNIGLINDYGGNVGFAYAVVPMWSVGIVTSRITRFGSDVPIGASTLANLSNSAILNQLSNQGVGYAIDFGTNFILPGPLKPTLSFVWKNLGTTTFSLDTGVRAPPMVQDSMIWGFGMDIDLPALNIRPAIDFKYANRFEIDLSKKVHFGAEFEFPAFAIRGGFYQGYYTLGVGVNLGAFHIDAATYGVELGEYASQQQDRRYVLELSIDLGFDPGGLFGGNNRSSGGGALKQRR